MSDRIREELRAYAVVAAYLYVWLGAIVLYRAAVLEGVGVDSFPMGFAIVKALILGKFALLGKAAGLGDRGDSGAVLARIARKATLFVVLLLVLSGVEKLVEGWWHARTFAETIADFGPDPALQILADAVLLLLAITPLIATVEISRALGPGVLAGVLRGAPVRPGAGSKSRDDD